MRIIPVLLAGLLTFAHVSAALAVDIEVVNKSKTAIHHVYVSEPDKDTWGDDQLGDDDDDIVKPGESFTIEDLDAGRYDLKLVAADKTVCVIKNVRVGSDKVWTITEEMLDKC